MLRWPRRLARVATVALAWPLFLAAVGRGEPIALGSISVYSPKDVDAFVVSDGGLARLEFPGAAPWALACEGGPYQPMPIEEVVEALNTLSYPADPLDAAILILSCPRRDLLESSAEGTVVFLSPGRVDYPTEHVHYTVAHEMGHVLHHVLMPDSRQDLWAEYASLRAIDRGYAGNAAGHAWRIHEIFAEDFRALFGGLQSQCGAGIENRDLIPPDQVTGLRDFFLSLPERWKDVAQVRVGPNPFTDWLAIEALGLADNPHIDGVVIYDVEGRLVAVVAPADPSGRKAIWDGSRCDGTSAVPGAYFAAITGASRTQTIKVLKIPR